MNRIHQSCISSPEASSCSWTLDCSTSRRRCRKWKVNQTFYFQAVTLVYMACRWRRWKGWLCQLARKFGEQWLACWASSNILESDKVIQRRSTGLQAAPLHSVSQSERLENWARLAASAAHHSPPRLHLSAPRRWMEASWTTLGTFHGGLGRSGRSSCKRN